MSLWVLLPFVVVLFLFTAMHACRLSETFRQNKKQKTQKLKQNLNQKRNSNRSNRSNPSKTKITQSNQTTQSSTPGRITYVGKDNATKTVNLLQDVPVFFPSTAETKEFTLVINTGYTAYAYPKDSIDSKLEIGQGIIRTRDHAQPVYIVVTKGTSTLPTQAQLGSPMIIKFINPYDARRTATLYVEENGEVVLRHKFKLTLKPGYTAKDGNKSELKSGDYTASALSPVRISVSKSVGPTVSGSTPGSGSGGTPSPGSGSGGTPPGSGGTPPGIEILPSDACLAALADYKKDSQDDTRARTECSKFMFDVGVRNRWVTEDKDAECNPGCRSTAVTQRATEYTGSLTPRFTVDCANAISRYDGNKDDGVTGLLSSCKEFMWDVVVDQNQTQTRKHMSTTDPRWALVLCGEKGKKISPTEFTPCNKPEMPANERIVSTMTGMEAKTDRDCFQYAVGTEERQNCENSFNYIYVLKDTSIQPPINVKLIQDSAGIWNIDGGVSNSQWILSDKSDKYIARKQAGYFSADNYINPFKCGITHITYSPKGLKRSTTNYVSRDLPESDRASYTIV